MPYFTKDNARSFAIQAVQARADIRKTRAQRDALVDFCLKKFADQPVQTIEQPKDDPTFAARRLARVRAQLDRLDAMMEAEEEPAALDRLASAQARLSEQEFALAGRPKPKACDVGESASRRPEPPLRRESRFPAPGPDDAVA